MNRRIPSLVVSLASFALLPMSVRAQDADPQLADYRQIATQGQEAFNGGEYADARRLWEQARSIRPNPRVFALLGRVAVALGDHVEAVRMYRLALSAPENSNPLAQDRRREIEQDLLPQALALVGEIELVVAPAGASIAVDGEAVLVEGGAILLPPGNHTLHARSAGFRDHEEMVDVAAGSRDSLRITLERDGTEATIAQSGDAEPAGPASHADPDLAGPLALFGVAAAGVAVLAVSGGLALAEDGRLTSGCGASRSCSDAQVSDLRALTLVADVGWISAAIAGAAGIAWLAVALAGGGESASAVGIVPWVAADGGGVVIAGEIGEF